MNGQIGLFDYMPTLQKEPEVGEWVDTTGANIPHIMRRSYIGRKVVFDVSTQSRTCYRVGILEAVRDDHYYQLEDGTYQPRPCDMVVIFTGKRQRSLISLMPGREIFESLPWDAYEARNKAIRR